jgi:hypothetical protein
VTDGFIKAELSQLLREGEKEMKSSTKKKNDFPLIWATFTWSDRWFHKIESISQIRGKCQVYLE